MRVVMLTNNDWRIDSRVTREADALARRGFQVEVVYRRPGTRQGQEEEKNGVRYVCVPIDPWRTRDVFALLRVHLLVLATDAARLLRGPHRISALTSAVQLAVTLLILFLALPFSPIAALLVWQKKRIPLVHKALIYVIQPFLYLNQYASRCTDAITARRPDVIHAHDLATLSCIVTVSGIDHRSFVYDAHELETEINYWSHNAWTRYWIRRYEHVLIRCTGGVVTVCDSIAEWLARQYQIPKPTVVHNVPASLSGDAVVKRSVIPFGVRARLGLAPDTPLAVYVGSVTIDRGLELCVKAISYLPSAHLALIGPRQPETEEAVLKTALEAGVSARIHLVDPVPSDEVVEFLRDADCSVIAIQNVCLSYYFCLPNKLFESVMAGLPIATANLVELRRFVEETGVGIVMDETDPRDIARAISELLGNREKYRPTPGKLREISQRYGWPVQEQRLIELYRQI